MGARTWKLQQMKHLVFLGGFGDLFVGFKSIFSFLFLGSYLIEKVCVKRDQREGEVGRAHWKVR